MKTVNANLLRDTYVTTFADFLAERNEDVHRTGSNSIAFPVVSADGEEGWIEVVVKVPKWTEDDDGYSRASDYAAKVEEKKEKAIAKEAERKRKEEERNRKAAEKEAKKKAKEEAEASKGEE